MLTFASSVRSGVYVGTSTHVFAQLQQRGGQRVVVQTTAAVHAGGPGRDVGDAHAIERQEVERSEVRRE